MNDRAKIYRTPSGIAEDPWLTTPDTRFDPRGHYKVTLRLSADNAQPLITIVDDAMVASLAQAKKECPSRAKTIKATADKPYRTALDPYGSVTEDVLFRFGSLAKPTSKRTGETRINRPELFDAKAKPLDPTKTNIGDGATIKIAFEMRPFYIPFLGAGVVLRLRAVQVLNRVELAHWDAEAYGFVEEEGYDANESLKG